MSSKRPLNHFFLIAPIKKITSLFLYYVFYQLRQHRPCPHHLCLVAPFIRVKHVVTSYISRSARQEKFTLKMCTSLKKIHIMVNSVTKPTGKKRSTLRAVPCSRLLFVTLWYNLNYRLQHSTKKSGGKRIVLGII